MGMFERFPYTNFHDINLDWILRKVKELEDSLTKLWAEFLKSRVPVGGTKGQYLRKTSDDDYAMNWQDANGILPEGGSDGQVLTKIGFADYEAEWKNVPKELPENGATGDVLKHGDGDSIYWGPGDAAANGLPAGGNVGQVLKKSGTGDYEAEWADESGGGGSYLPLAGGTMDEGAIVGFTEAGGGHSELSSGELHHTGNPFQFVGDFNFQTHCPSSQGVPENPTDLATKDYVDGKFTDDIHSIPSGGSSGQVLKKSSDADYDAVWADESGGGSGDYLPLAGGTMNQDAIIHTPGTYSGGSSFSSLDGNKLAIQINQDGLMCNAVISGDGIAINQDVASGGYQQSGGIAPYRSESERGIIISGTDAIVLTRIPEVPAGSTPLADYELATKKYVDDAASGSTAEKIKSWLFPQSLREANAGSYLLPGYGDFRDGTSQYLCRLSARPGSNGRMFQTTYQVGGASQVSNWIINVEQSDGAIVQAGNLSIATSTSLASYVDAGNDIILNDVVLEVVKIDAMAVKQ